MVVLALETVTRAGSLAVIGDGIERAVVGDARRTHGERLPGELVDVLAAEQLAIADVTLFAVVSGPGSFTGLRVGMATIQGLALAAGRRVVAVPTLEAMVTAWRGGGEPSAPVVVPCLDGQRGDVFFASYAQADTLPAPRSCWPELLPPAVGRPEDLVARSTALSGTRPVALVGSGAERYRSTLLSIAGSRVEPFAMPLALAAAHLAAARASEAVGPHGVQPVYIRRPDAVIARERHRRAAGQNPPDPSDLVVELVGGPDDLAAVEALQRSAFAEAWGTEAFERELANRDVARVYVMRTRAGEIVAYCACWVIVDELHINSLAVSPSWRKRGVATRLLEAVSREARAAGAVSATLEVRESNHAARALYERLGFSVEGVRRDYYQAPREDALILWNRSLRRIG